MKRQQAIELGLKKYWGDVICKRGHDGWRYTSTGLCVACKSMYRSGLHHHAPRQWSIIEEQVHVNDVAAVRDYCQKLRDHRQAQIDKLSAPC